MRRMLPFASMLAQPLRLPLCCSFQLIPSCSLLPSSNFCLHTHAFLSLRILFSIPNPFLFLHPFFHSSLVSSASRFRSLTPSAFISVVIFFSSSHSFVLSVTLHLGLIYQLHTHFIIVLLSSSPTRFFCPSSSSNISFFYPLFVQLFLLILLTLIFTLHILLPPLQPPPFHASVTSRTKNTVIFLNSWEIRRKT